jgi:ABC-type multidrug transport system fused ATPase/permease subunit
MKFDEDKQPELNIDGEICYVPQKPWIMNGSVRENIIFNSEFDEKRYNESLKYSCLERDLTILSNGDQTMIGINFFKNFLSILM